MELDAGLEAVPLDAGRPAEEAHDEAERAAHAATSSLSDTAADASTKENSWKNIRRNLIQQLMPHRGFAFVWHDSWDCWQWMKKKFLINGLELYPMVLKPIIMILLTVPLFIMSTVKTAWLFIKNLIIWLIILFLITLLTGDWGSAIGSSKAKGGNDGFSVNGSMSKMAKVTPN